MFCYTLYHMPVIEKWDSTYIKPLENLRQLFSRNQLYVLMKPVSVFRFVNHVVQWTFSLGVRSMYMGYLTLSNNVVVFYVTRILCCCLSSCLCTYISPAVWYFVPSRTCTETIIIWIRDRLLDSLVVECWLWVRDVPGSIPTQGPRHTKDVI